MSFIIGLFVGGFLGVMVMALIAVSDDDKENELNEC